MTARRAAAVGVGLAVLVGYRQVPDGASTRLEFWRLPVYGSAGIRLADDAYEIALQPTP